ncbi:site-specific integrase, partial [Mangrovicoccus sp. HB161399]|uniref:site-specific integrase n=1 Tax=Mangrovicoccus sp. HB161399 TaxID=2720392 RepID=UPI001552E2CF
MPRHDAITVLASSKGRPWTCDGFQSSFQRLKKKLETKGAIKPGLTPKGLRHTMATWLREAGRSERDISDLLAQNSPAMGLHYSKDGAALFEGCGPRPEEPRNHRHLGGAFLDKSAGSLAGGFRGCCHRCLFSGCALSRPGHGAAADCFPGERAG